MGSSYAEGVVKVQSQGHWRYLGLDHKRSYQRNMAISLLIVTISSVVAIVIGSLFFGPGPSTLVRFTVSEPTLPTGFRNGGPGRHSAATAGERAHAVFAGGLLENIRIIPDTPRVSLTLTIPNDQPLSPLSGFDLGDPAAIYAQAGDGDGGGMDGDSDFGLPAENWLLPVAARFDLPAASEPDLSMRGHDRSAMIAVSNIMWPMTAHRSDTGYVVVDITIHEDETISYQFISEQPPGRGFRSVTEDAIVFRYDYKARIVNGQPVESTVRLYITICYDCEPAVAVISGKVDYLVSMKTE